MKKVFALILAIAVLASLFCVNAFAGQTTIRDWDPAKEVAACCDGWKFDRQSSLTSFSPTAENNVIDNTANECMERLVVQIWFGAVNGKPSRVGLLIDASDNILWAPERGDQGWGFYEPGAGAVTAGGANTVASFMNIPANVLPADGKTHTLTVVADFDSEIVKLKDTMHGSIDMAFTFKAPNARNFIGKKSTAKSSLYNPLGTTGLSYQDNLSWDNFYINGTLTHNGNGNIIDNKDYQVDNSADTELASTYRLQGWFGTNTVAPVAIGYQVDDGAVVIVDGAAVTRANLEGTNTSAAIDYDITIKAEDLPSDGADHIVRLVAKLSDGNFVKLNRYEVDDAGTVTKDRDVRIEYTSPLVEKPNPGPTPATGDSFAVVAVLAVAALALVVLKKKAF